MSVLNEHIFYINVPSLPSEDNPIWVQTTVASASSHESSQTVPHLPSKQISTLPTISFGPPASLTSVSLHSGPNRAHRQNALKSH